MLISRITYRYLGLAVPDFPNMMLFVGPTWPVENGSVMGPLHTVSDYAVQIIKKMQNEKIRSWVPRQDIVSEVADIRKIIH